MILIQIHEKDIQIVSQEVPIFLKELIYTLTLFRARGFFLEDVIANESSKKLHEEKCFCCSAKLW